MRSWSINRVCALVLGIIFLILGLVGFVTPAENSTGVQAIFGIFDSDTIHNVFYVIVGLLGMPRLLQASSAHSTRSLASSLFC